METVLGRYRNLIILVGVLFLQALGLAVQVKRSSDTQDTRLIRIWAVGAITPLERGLVWVQNGVGGLWHNYIYLRGVRAENRQLKEQIEHMRLEQVRLSEDAAQARRLQSLLAFKEQFISRTVAAQVIGSSASDSSRIIYIDKGESAGLKRDMAVTTADGIVGKVLQVFPSVAQVLLINDQSSGVGAILEKSRLQGVLRGTPDGEILLERVMSDEHVAVGETLQTSGGDQIFPKGLPVGKVASVGGKEKETFLNIKVKPSADLSRLEEVLVVLEKQERQAVAPDTVRVRAADILAERLPSVPETPVAAANGAGSANPGKPAGSPGSSPAISNSDPKSQTPGGTGAKPLAGATAKPTAPASSANPNASSSTGVKPTAVKPTGVNPTGVGAPSQAVKNTATTPGSVPVKGQPTTSGAAKPAVEKTVQKTALPKGAASGASKPATTGPKPAASQPNSETNPPKTAAPPNSQPPAAEDSPN
jgi:rod shape-determining protein MreC